MQLCCNDLLVEVVGDINKLIRRLDERLFVQMTGFAGRPAAVPAHSIHGLSRSILCRNSKSNSITGPADVRPSASFFWAIEGLIDLK